MATKIVKLYYNGEVGWNATIQQVYEFYKIQQPIRDWMDAIDEAGETNAGKIIAKWDNATKVRAQYATRLEIGRAHV